MCVGGAAAAYSELLHSDLTSENVNPSAPTFQMHEGSLALTEAEQQTFIKSTLEIKSPDTRRHERFQ